VMAEGDQRLEVGLSLVHVGTLDFALDRMENLI
jgi:hypothetical protein